jgi:hypothetical protein
MSLSLLLEKSHIAPLLGVSSGILGQMLEAPNIHQLRSEILKYSLIRSMDNLEGKCAL